MATVVIRPICTKCQQPFAPMQLRIYTAVINPAYDPTYHFNQRLCHVLCHYSAAGPKGSTADVAARVDKIEGFHLLSFNDQQQIIDYIYDYHNGFPAGTTWRQRLASLSQQAMAAPHPSLNSPVLTTMVNPQISAQMGPQFNRQNIPQMATPISRPLNSIAPLNPQLQPPRGAPAPLSTQSGNLKPISQNGKSQAATRKPAPRPKKRKSEIEDEFGAEEEEGEEGGWEEKPKRKKARTGTRGRQGELRLSVFPFPGSFEVPTGQLLWGQIHLIALGNKTPMSAVVERPKPDADAKAFFSHRAAARVGTWKVSRVIMQSPKFEEDEIIAFLSYHSSENGVRILRDVLSVLLGTPHPNVVHVDKDAFENESIDLLDEVLDNDEEDDDTADLEEFLQNLRTNRMILLDAIDGPALIKKLRRKPKLEDDKHLIIANHGVHLSQLGGDGEQAWMVYSGHKHQDFPEREELIAFLYDPTYSILGSLESDPELQPFKIFLEDEPVLARGDFDQDDDEDGKE